MATGQYDGVSASGDASNRMIAAGTVAPVNTDLIPNYADIFDALKNKPHNSVDGVPYGVPHGRGANVLLYNTEVFPEAPTSWDPVWEGAARARRQDQHLQLPDLHRRCRPAPDAEAARPWDHRSLPAQPGAVRRGSRAAQGSRASIAIYWGTAAEQIASFAAGDAVVGTSWQYRPTT